MRTGTATGERFMRASDAFSWYMEQDPVLRSTVVAVVWLDGRPDWATLTAKLEQASRQVPMFRQRVMDLPGRLTPPRWTDVADFDLSWHVSRIDAAEPGDDQEVMDFARREAMTGFDRAHPLWRFTLIEGLSGGRAALVMKIHHSLTDGVGGMQLAMLLFDPDRRLPPVGDAPAPPVEAPPEGAGLLAQRVGWRAVRSLGSVAHGAQAAVPALASTARSPVKAVSAAAQEVASVARTVAPIRQTLSPLMTGRSLKRHLSSMSVPLAELKAASTVTGGSLNDGFLAAVTAGLRIYHQRHGVRVDRLRVTMPINLRTAEDRPGGNRITLMRFTVPVGETNAARRVAGIRRAAWQARHEPSLPLTDAIAGALNMLPAAVIGSILKNVDFLASDVPGFPQQVYLAGAAVERYEAFGPTTGTAVNVTLLSYRGTCSIGVTMDTAAVPDPDLFMDSLQQGFAELMTVGQATSHDGSATDRSASTASGAGGADGNASARTEVELDARSSSQGGGSPDEI